jgi:hypothetical protein
MNMIEIEVEMEMQVAAAELAGIEEQLVRLEELEELKGEWQVQAEAQDEVRGSSSEHAGCHWGIMSQTGNKLMFVDRPANIQAEGS